MAMFLGEISFLFALGLFAAGLVLWHHGRERSAGLVRVAGAVLGVGSVLTAVCTVYFMIAYHVQGDFDSAYPSMMGSEMMGPGMMGPGMMGRGRMRGMMGRGPWWGEGEEGWERGRGMPPELRERWMRRMHPEMWGEEEPAPKLESPVKEPEAAEKQD